MHLRHATIEGIDLIIFRLRAQFHSIRLSVSESFAVLIRASPAQKSAAAARELEKAKPAEPSFCRDSPLTKVLSLEMLLNF